MINEKYSWVDTHNKITQYLSTKENSQQDLINLLKSVGIGPFNDESSAGVRDIELDEIDPFTFFCYIYKYGPERRLKYLQQIAEKLEIEKPYGESGIPSAQAQKVWLFPYKYDRNNNEVSRLWKVFNKELNDQLTDQDFADALQIQSVGKTKLTEALFYINPEKYLPINGPTKPYIKKVLGIDPSFNTYNEYKEILSKIKQKTQLPFYELSYEAWKWNDESSNSEKQYWLYAPGEKARKWDEFYNDGIMGLGWDEIGDVAQYTSRDEIKKAIIGAYGGAGSKSNDVSANDDFLNKVRVGDVVIAKKGRGALLGYGVVTSDYFYDKNRNEYQKVRKVDWKLKGNWEVDFSLVLKTLTDITKYSTDHPDYNFFYERLLGIMKVKDQIQMNVPLNTVLNVNVPLNTILYGPPGTGKTYNTILRAAEIVENRKIDSYDEALKNIQQKSSRSNRVYHFSSKL